MNGQGKLEWADGKSYEGEYKCDLKHGKGIFSWQDGRKYIGTWVNGQ